MKKISLAVAAALLLASGGSFAASLSISPAVATALPGAGNPTNPTPITVQWDNSGLAAGEGDSIDGNVLFDDTKFSVSVTGDCAVNGGDPGDVIIAALNIQGNTIASGTLCTMTFTTLAGAADLDVVPLDLANTVVGDGGVALMVQPPATDGVINVLAAPPTPPNVAFTPDGGAVNLTGGVNAGDTSSASIIGVAANGGTAGGSASYSCTVPANFQATNSSNPAVLFGTDPADMSVTCTLTTAVQNANMTCTRTGGAPTTDVVFNLSCPAGAVVPVVPTITTVSPAPSSSTNMPGGQIGQTVTSTINYSASGGVGSGSASISCATAAPLSVSPPNQNVVGTAQPIDPTVSCSLTDIVQNGSVTCTITDFAGARSETYDYVCPAGVAIVAPTQPAIIPATSLWTKLGLVGLLAALGMLVVGFRRQH